MDRCAGLWRRSLLIDTDGSCDTVSDVRWLQGKTAFVDLRLGADGVQDGFAGKLRQTGSMFTWDRFVGVAPPGPYPAEGQMHWDRGVLVEVGVHADYLEHWVREDTPSEPCWALDVSTDDGARGLLLRVGAVFGWACTQAAGPEISLGHIEGELWTITGSSHPERTGMAVLPVLCDGVLTLSGSAPGRWTVIDSEGDVKL